MKTILLIISMAAASLPAQTLPCGSVNGGEYCIVVNQTCDWTNVEAVMYAWYINAYSTWHTNVVMPPHSQLYMPAPFLHTDTVGVAANGDSTYWLWRPLINGNLGLLGQSTYCLGTFCTNAVPRTNSVLVAEPVFVRCKLPDGSTTNKLWKIIRARQPGVVWTTSFQNLNY